jgi:hypothetical protein
MRCPNGELLGSGKWEQKRTDMMMPGALEGQPSPRGASLQLLRFLTMHDADMRQKPFSPHTHTPTRTHARLRPSISPPPPP